MSSRELEADLANGILNQQDYTEAVFAGILQINAAVSTFVRLALWIGTPQDTQELREQLDKTRQHIRQSVNDTIASLKQANKFDHGPGVSASKKLEDAKLALDLEAVLIEFEKAEMLEVERLEASLAGNNHMTALKEGMAHMKRIMKRVVHYHHPQTSVEALKETYSPEPQYPEIAKAEKYKWHEIRKLKEHVHEIKGLVSNVLHLRGVDHLGTELERLEVNIHELTSTALQNSEEELISEKKVEKVAHDITTAFEDGMEQMEDGMERMKRFMMRAVHCLCQGLEDTEIEETKKKQHHARLAVSFSFN